jgi:ligand-binding SRPBCC domain-containing protein
VLIQKIREYLHIFRYSFIVKSPIERVWYFYTDINHLKIITPKQIDLNITKATSPNIVQGQEIWCNGKIIAKRRTTWHSKITFLKSYEYIDEMLDGPFKKWRHVHKFRNLDEKQTEVIDEIEFELPYGVLGKLFEGYAYKQLQRTFQYRKVATINALENI